MIRRRQCVPRQRKQITDLAEYGQKSLCLCGGLEALHSALALAGWLVRVFGTVVGPFVSGVSGARQDLRTWLKYAASLPVTTFRGAWQVPRNSFLKNRIAATLLRWACNRIYWRPNFSHQVRILSYDTSTPRWAMSSSTSRKLRENRKYSQTQWLIMSGV
jgi:hypothetical protein